MHLGLLKYLLPILILLTGCKDRSYYFKESREIGSWKSDETIAFENILVKSPSEVVLAIEITEEYAFENIYLNGFITESQDTLFNDIFSIQLMDSGYWLGEKRGKVFHAKEILDTTLSINPVRMNVQIEQFSREQSLEGVERVWVMLKAL